MDKPLKAKQRCPALPCRVQGSVPGKGCIPPGSCAEDGACSSAPAHGDSPAYAASSQKPTVTPSLSPSSCLMPFSPSQNSSTQVLSLVVSWGFISSCQGLLLGVTAVQVWLPCRVHIKEHTLLLIFLILSHGLRLQAASPRYSRALCLPRHSRVPEAEPS